MGVAQDGVIREREGVMVRVACYGRRSIYTIQLSTPIDVLFPHYLSLALIHFLRLPLTKRVMGAMPVIVKE